MKGEMIPKAVAFTTTPPSPAISQTSSRPMTRCVVKVTPRFSSSDLRKGKYRRGLIEFVVNSATALTPYSSGKSDGDTAYWITVEEISGIFPGRNEPQGPQYPCNSSEARSKGHPGSTPLTFGSKITSVKGSHTSQKSDLPSQGP